MVSEDHAQRLYCSALNVSERAMSTTPISSLRDTMLYGKRQVHRVLQSEVEQAWSTNNRRNRDKEERKQMVWIENDWRRTAPAPVIFTPSGDCRHPQVKGMTMMGNRIYNGSASKTSGRQKSL